MAGWSGRVFRDAVFVHALAFAIDPEEREKYRMWRAVYLSRYGRIQLREQAELTSTRLDAFVQAVSELLRREAALSREHEDNFL